MAKQVLIVTSHYTPNVGGVETHLSDLVTALTKNRWKVAVATYQPLAKNTIAPFFEESRYLKIYRFPWIGFNIVHKLTKYPLLEFLYLFPGLFLVTGWSILRNRHLLVVHAQGLVPAVICLFWTKIFLKRLIVSTHNLYFFSPKGIYRQFSRFILSRANSILVLSEASQAEIESLGVPKKLIIPFRYWLDLKLFRPIDKKKARETLGINQKDFVIFFIGRLIETKGIRVVVNVAKSLHKQDIKFVIAGSGPFETEVKEQVNKTSNLVYVGSISQQIVPTYMSAADLVIAPSLVDEGYGRVAMEAIACGTPVLAARKGGLSEVVGKEVGWLANPTKGAFLSEIKRLYKKRKELEKTVLNTRGYALKNFSSKNVLAIIKEYEKEA